jgi:hypothetical protein
VNLAIPKTDPYSGLKASASEVQTKPDPHIWVALRGMAASLRLERRYGGNAKPPEGDAIHGRAFLLLAVSATATTTSEYGLCSGVLFPA